MIVNVTVFRN